METGMCSVWALAYTTGNPLVTVRDMLKGPVKYWFWNPTLPLHMSGRAWWSEVTVAAPSLAHQEQSALCR